jgi:hypothetical protein
VGRRARQAGEGEAQYADCIAWLWVRITLLAIFAIAMGHLEGVVVYYIRLNLGGIAATVNIPSAVTRDFPWGIEATREFATLVMLTTLALLVGRGWLERLAALLWAFALWDATYYASLRLMTGWPQSLTTQDVYFLLPFPWGGPVWVPLLADALMITAAAAILRGAVPFRRVAPGQD